ncbi:MAG TPA: hypothetical protein VFD42_06525, partial [Chloroflexota bacterium]|nr:hypothetical protein [Chloroflexota bacterium]
GTMVIAIGILVLADMVPGGAFGSWFAGYLFDATGSYLAAFALAACCSLAGGACMWLAAPRKVRRAQR